MSDEKPKHTPGPLTVLQNKRDDADVFIIVDGSSPKKKVLARVARGPDADLYAAATALLAALQALKAAPANDHAQQLAAWRMAHAAIAKAEGRE